MDEQLKKAHEWTNADGDVLLVRFVDMDYQSYGGFQWPKEVGAIVKPETWTSTPECGNGLHGWAWGLSMGDGKDPIFTDAIWQVVAARPDDIVDLGGKVKANKVRIVYQGSWWKALSLVEADRTKWIEYYGRGAASATGDRGAASATGWRGAASATGWRGAASATGDSGAASATGWRGAASATGDSGAASATGDSDAASATGDRGAASATGWRGAASATGDSGAASATGWRGAASATGEYSTVECGRYGLACSTASIVTWIARPGAVFVQRWIDEYNKKGGVKICTFGGLKASDGERITFKNGKITKREQLTA